MYKQISVCVKISSQQVLIKKDDKNNENFNETVLKNY